MTNNSTYVDFWFEDGILLQIFKPEVDKVTLEVAKAVVRERKKLTKGKKYPLLVDFSYASSIDKEARDYWATEEGKDDVSYSGLVMSNYLAFLAAKLFMAFNKPGITTELFRTRQQAKEWLLSYKHNE
ncbi:hypothetical protein RCC89_13035 [Cytophagaceae bacterium ABcell3]|nr:hypothetical protein RCC89_13035 [Cytophagaceae bacterium ABcell3]